MRQAKAEAQKTIAKAEGEAKANQILTQSIIEYAVTNPHA